MADDTRHLWAEGQKTKCGIDVAGGMKMTDDPAQSDCAACKQ